MRLELAIESKKIEVRIPLKEYKIKTQDIANMLGDSYLLSATDLDLLALALELKKTGFNPKVVTDDYSMQNVAKQMKIDFIPVTTIGIKHILKWSWYCPACHKKYNSKENVNECSICGTLLKRKPKKKESDKIGRKKGKNLLKKNQKAE